MTLPNLTLTMDKRTNSQQKLHLRQSERGLSLTAQLLDYSGAPYDLTGMLVRFKDAKAGGKSVSDDNVTIANDPKTGVITYPVHSQVFAADGIGWFEVYNTDGGLVDSTQNIPIMVDRDISAMVDNSDYISGLSGLKTQLQGIINSAQQTLDNAVSGANTSVNDANQAAKSAQALANSIPTDPKYRGPQGIKGDTGATGPVGPQGVKGDKGDTGATGPIGPAGPIGLSGKNGKDGTSVQIKGSADSADNLPATGNDTGDTYLVKGHLYVWKGNIWVDAGELQGPQGIKGDDGDVGAQGPRGAQGPKGDTGDVGPIGPQGPKGDKGDVGPIGPQGEHGIKGDTGATGQIGPQGPKGDTGSIGPIGPVGPTGLPGKDGKDGTGIQIKGTADSVDKLPATGNTAGDTYLIAGHLYIWKNDVWADGGELQGPKGDEGRSAYQVWLDAGNTGTQADFLATLKGANGKDGVTPDLTPYLKTADADKKYQTATQVQAIVDAKVVPVPDEATATSNSATNTTVLYLVPEAS